MEPISVCLSVPVGHITVSQAVVLCLSVHVRHITMSQAVVLYLSVRPCRTHYYVTSSSVMSVCLSMSDTLLCHKR